MPTNTHGCGTNTKRSRFIHLRRRSNPRARQLQGCHLLVAREGGQEANVDTLEDLHIKQATITITKHEYINEHGQSSRISGVNRGRREHKGGFREYSKQGGGAVFS